MLRVNGTDRRVAPSAEWSLTDGRLKHLAPVAVAGGPVLVHLTALLEVCLSPALAVYHDAAAHEQQKDQHSSYDDARELSVAKGADAVRARWPSSGTWVRDLNVLVWVEDVAVQRDCCRRLELQIAGAIKNREIWKQMSAKSLIDCSI